jgi:hypothetical protein
VTQETSTWQEVVLVAGPAIAAIAAMASWATVWQARRLARESRAPLLMIQKIVDPQTQTMTAIVTNAGGGAARGAGVLLSHPPYRAEGNLGHGFIYPGQARRVWTNIPATEVDTDVMAVCRDGEGFPHYWTADEEHKVFKTWFRRRPHPRGDVTVVFSEFYPQIAYQGLTPMQFRVTDQPI